MRCKNSVSRHSVLVPLCKLYSFGLIIAPQVLNFGYLIRKHVYHFILYLCIVE